VTKIGRITYHAVADVIERTTCKAIGVGISPHMFRTAAASGAAVHADYNPYLGSALLHHHDKRVTEEYFNPASSPSAANDYGRLIRQHIEEALSKS
jgi:integrase